MIILQLFTNFFLFLLSLVGFVFNKRSILVTLICIELMLLSINLNFIVFSAHLDDILGQVFSIFILTVAAAESSIGLAIVILFGTFYVISILFYLFSVLKEYFKDSLNSYNIKQRSLKKKYIMQGSIPAKDNKLKFNIKLFFHFNIFSSIRLEQ